LCAHTNVFDWMSLDVNATAWLPWLKALHIGFVVCWFAGLFYLPRLFVNHALVEDEATRRQLGVMERKLFRFMTPLAWLAVGFGLWLLYLGWEDYYRSQGWMRVKLGFVALLVVYHLACGRFVREFEASRNHHSHLFYRVFNELPVIILFSTVILVVVRPF
jgi:protoporphyrinogen IX oxidase